MARLIDWHPDLRDAITAHTKAAHLRLNPERYAQEPAYVAAFLARLDGIAYDGPEGYVEFESTIVADRGPNSAESRFGADFAVIANLKRKDFEVRKAVLGQAKLGDVEDQSKSELKRLNWQCRKMHCVTDAIVALEVPIDFESSPMARRCLLDTVEGIDGHGKFQRSIALGEDADAANDDVHYEFSPSVTFGDYLANRLVPCLHGDTRVDFIQSVCSSKLSRLELIVRG